MTLIYQGPYDSVFIPCVGTYATKDQPIDLPADIASNLLMQDTWRKAS